MKRKYADRPNWKRIIEKYYSSMYVDDENFRGHVAMINLHKVREPLWVQYGQQRLCIVDDGYIWLQHVPEQGGHVLTSTFSSEGELVQCYFDIVKSVGTTQEGIPYWDDLYTDVVALPNGALHILDEDELEEAYLKSKISKTDYDYAKEEAQLLIQSIKSKTNYQMLSTRRYYLSMVEKLGRDCIDKK